MKRIDGFVEVSRLTKWPTEIKMVISLIGILCIISSKWLLLDIGVLLFFLSLILIGGGLTIKILRSWLMLPLGFMVLNFFQVICSWSSRKLDFVWCFKLNAYYFGVTPSSLRLGELVFVRGLSAFVALYFLIVSTSFLEICRVLERLKCPKLLIELMLLMYRMIHIILETGFQIFCAQDSRLGYVNYFTSFRSLGLLGSRLFIISFHKANTLNKSLIARGYEGGILDESRKYH